MVRHRKWSCKDRCRLAILAVAVSKKERVDSRKAVGYSAILAHEATLDARSTIDARVVIKDEVLGPHVDAHTHVASYSSIFEQRCSLDACPALDMHLAQEAHTQNSHIILDTTHLRAMLRSPLSHHTEQTLYGLAPVAHHSHQVGRLRRKLTIDGCRAATILVHCSHLDTLAKRGCVAALHTQYRVDKAVIANMIVYHRRVDDAATRADAYIALEAHVAQLLDSEIFRD